MQEKINNIFESMARDARLAETYEGNLVTDQIRRSFYKAVSTPVCLMNTQEMDEHRRRLKVARLVEDAIRGWFGTNMASSNIDYIVVSDIDLTNNTFKLSCGINCVLWVRDKDTGREVKQTKYLLIDSKRKMKLSSYFDKYFQATLRELNGDGSAYEQCYTQARIVSDVQAILKKYSASLSGYDPSKCAWVYFTTTDVPYHYESLYRKQYISSCMSHSVEFYGNKLDGKDVHPLEGYHYAPDFRLGLVSYHDPESIKTCTEYPFVGRVIVFTNRIDAPIAYSRYYGDENVAPRIHTAFTHVEKPIGKQFYAVKVTSNEGQNTHDVVEYIRDNADRVEGFLVAPFIDKWSNAFFPVDEVTIKREDGREVMLMEVCESIDDKDKDDFYDYSEYKSTWNLRIYYETGIVHQQKADGIGTYTLERGEWVCGEQEW